MNSDPISLPYLMSDLYLASFTGKLNLKQNDLVRSILFHSGNPVNAFSQLQEETLGRILFEEGTITVEQYDTVLKAMLETKKQAGELLISKGILSPQEVFSALEFQMQKKIFNCFRLVTFEYELKAEPVAPEMIISRLEVVELLLNCVYSSYSVDRLLNEFPVDEETLISLQKRPNEIQMHIGSMENRILRSIGTATTLAILMATGFDVHFLLTVLYVFHALQIIDVSDVARPRTGLTLTDGKEPDVAHKRNDSDGRDKVEDNPRLPTLVSLMADQVEPNLAKKLLALAQQNHFEVLKVTQNSNDSEIKKAFDRLAKEFRLEEIDESYSTVKEREAANRLLERATLALNVLSNQESRQEYLSNLNQTDNINQSISPRILAGIEAQKGEEAISERRWDEAKSFFNKAIALQPNEPSYYFQLGKLGYLQALAETPPGQNLNDSIRQPFLKALALDPQYDQPRMYLGYFAKRNGNFEQAITEFTGALEFNPNNRVAQSQLEILKKRLKN